MPGRGQELHGAECPGAGRAHVAPVPALDLADGGEHRPGQAGAVPGGGLLEQLQVTSGLTASDRRGVHGKWAGLGAGWERWRAPGPGRTAYAAGQRGQARHPGSADQRGHAADQAERAGRTVADQHVDAGHAERRRAAEGQVLPGRPGQPVTQAGGRAGPEPGRGVRRGHEAAGRPARSTGPDPTPWPAASTSGTACGSTPSTLTCWVPSLIAAPSAVSTSRTPEILPILAIWAALSPFGAITSRSGRMILLIPPCAATAPTHRGPTVRGPAGRATERARKPIMEDITMPPAARPQDPASAAYWRKRQ